MAEQEQGKGRFVAVIGGASGIGAATSVLLAERGWRVLVCDLQREPAEAVAKQCGGAAVVLDVTDADMVERVAGEMESTHGPVEGVAMCAAIFQPRRPPEETPIADWDKIVAVCMRGTYLVDVAFGQRMARRGRGSIVNLSSYNAHRAAPMHAYCSAKAAVDSLTEGMAGEWGRSGVRVNTVTPGTTLVARVVDRIKSGTRYTVHPQALTALGRLVEPVEVAKTIAFLLSEEASGITGANIAVDAGMLVAPSWDIFGGVPAARS